MTVAVVRALIPDKPQRGADTATGDGSTTDYELAHAPVQAGTLVVRVGGIVQSLGYTVDVNLGVVSFSSPPTLGVALAFSYQHTLLSDDDLSTFLTLEGNDDRLAAAQALDALAANQALVLKVLTLMDLRTDGAAVSRELRARAAALREQANQYGAGAFDIAELVTTPFAARERIEKEWQRGG